MKDRYWLRTWAGPLTIGSFGVVATTGILMFFHADSGSMKLAHEWLGWLLVLGVIAHVVLNKDFFLGWVVGGHLACFIPGDRPGGFDQTD